MLRRGGEPLRDLGEPRERRDALARLLVELRVLDRAADERRGVREQLDVLLGELARGGGVQHDHADHVARARGDRDRGHRLPALLLELGEVLHARVVERLVADQRGPLVARAPSRSRPRRGPSRSCRRTRGAPATPRAARAGRRRAGRSGTRGSRSPRSRCRRRPPAPRRSPASRTRSLMTARSVTASSRAPMCTSHTLIRAGPATDSIAGPGAARLYHLLHGHRDVSLRGPAPRRARRARRRVRLRPVRRHARQAERQARAGRAPRRPARRRRRVRRLRGRRHRPGAARSGHRRDAGHAHAHPAAVEAGDRALRLRRHGRGRAVAVLPAHDPAQPARPRQGARLRLQDGLRARVLPRAQARGRHDRARRPARRPRSALLRHARADALARLRHRRRAPRQRARLGQLRDRPRGRERPVRAELPVRRRARHVRPRDLLPLHGRVARAGARADRDVHAEAVRAPDRQRLPLPHEPVGRRAQRVRATRRRPARARA